MPIFFGILLVIGTLIGVREAASLTQLSTKALATVEQHIPDDLTKAISLGSFTLKSASGTSLSGSCTGSTVSLSWTPLDNAAGYTVFRGDEVAGEVAGITFEEKDVDTADDVCYTVRGKIKHSDNQIGYVLSDQSNVVCVSENSCAAATGTPTGSVTPTSAASPTETPTPTSIVTPTPPRSGTPTPTPDSRCQSSVTYQGKPVVSVAKFGNNIQSAIDCFKNIASAGGVVYIPAGSYTAPEKIRLYSNVTLFGESRESTIIRIGKDDNGMSNDSTRGKTNIVIRDLSLLGPGTSGTNCCYGIKLTTLSNSYVINVSSNNWSMDGIYMQDAINVRVSGCEANNNSRNGISLTKGSGNVIDNCQLSGNDIDPVKRASAIDLEPEAGDDVSGNIVRENTTTGNKGNGIGLGPNPNNPGGKVTNNSVCYNTGSNNDFANVHGYKQNIFVSNNGGKFEDADCAGQCATGPESACSIPPTLSSLPAKPPAVLGASTNESQPGVFSVFGEIVQNIRGLLSH